MDKRLHGTQDADMRQTLAGVCQNNIREAARHPKNIKTPLRGNLFAAQRKTTNTFTKKLPQGHQKDAKTDPKTTNKMTQKHKGPCWCKSQSTRDARNLPRGPCGGRGVVQNQVKHKIQYLRAPHIACTQLLVQCVPYSGIPKLKSECGNPTVGSSWALFGDPQAEK